MEVFLSDGTSTGKVAAEYPLGHRRRHAEGITRLEQELLNALRTRFPAGQAERICALGLDAERQQLTSVNAFTDLFAT